MIHGLELPIQAQDLVKAHQTSTCFQNVYHYITDVSHLKSKDIPTQITKQSFTYIYFITYRKLYTLKSFTEMFTIVDNIFHALGYSSSNPKLKHK